MVSCIETSVNKPLCFNSTLYILNIQPDDCYIGDTLMIHGFEATVMLLKI